MDDLTRDQPAQFCRAGLGCGYGTDHAQDIKFAKGTTTLAFKVLMEVEERV